MENVMDDEDILDDDSNVFDPFEPDFDGGSDDDRPWQSECGEDIYT